MNQDYKVVFYEKANGEKPVEDFLTSLSPKIRAKSIGMLEILQEKGTNLKEPYSKYLCDGIFEIRCRQGTDIVRLLYFFHVGRIVVLTNGFVKKTQKTPIGEIEIAKKRRKDYLERVGKDEKSGSI